jgi:toxin ParE1/3/4
MQIKWLRTALINLDAEANYIERENPQAAQAVVQRIHRSVAMLATNPKLGHAGRVAGTRELPIPGTRYLVPYRINIDAQRVEILRVFHTSRKPPLSW